ncbi:MAG: enoyl-CoA hydratase-related protein [Pseudomonadota bacterium]
MSDENGPEKEILLDIADCIGTITVNRPDRRNSFTIDMLDPWHDAIEECRTNSDVRVVILTGAGNAFFCGGGDTSKLGGNVVISPQTAKAQFEVLHRIARGMRGLDKPSIAMVNGLASGAGMDMALHCDIRILADHANMAIPYLRFGLYPGNGAAYFLPRIVGTAKALELIWSGEPIDAQEALRLGLANKVVPAADLLTECRGFAEMLANSPPLALKLIRRGVYQSADLSLDAALELTSSHMAITRTSADHAEAVAAYTEGREPVYRGE